MSTPISEFIPSSLRWSLAACLLACACSAEPAAPITGPIEAPASARQTPAIGAFELIYPYNGLETGPRVAFNWQSASDASTYDLMIDGQPYVTDLTSTSHTLSEGSALGGGPHIWTVMARDGAGGSKAATSTWTVIVDATPPEAFELLNPLGGSFANATTEFQWAATSDAGLGLDDYEVWVDGELCKGGISPSITEIHIGSLNCQLGDGEHTWWVEAIDEGGNLRRSDPPEGASFTLDTVPPGYLDFQTFSVSPNYIPPAGYATGLFVEEGQTLEFYSTGEWCFSNDASCSIECRDADGSGSQTRPATGCAFGELLARIGDSGWYCVGESRSFTAPQSAEIILAANDDDDDNCGSKKLKTRIGVLPSEDGPINLLSPEPNTWVGEGDPTLSWTQVEDVGTGLQGYVVEVGGQSHDLAPGVGQWTIDPPLPEGETVWRVTASDRAGNTSQTSWANLGVDQSPPDAFSLSSPTDGACSPLLTPTLCWKRTYDDGAGVGQYELWIDGELAIDDIDTTAYCATPILAPGIHQWTVYAEDKVGLRTAATDTYHLSVGGTVEICGNGFDDNCDGLADCADPTCTGEAACDGCLDADEDGWASCDGDCDDTSASVYPGAEERCDNLRDDDCDGDVDCADGSCLQDRGCAACVDADEDGWAGCDGDCDDASSVTWPGATELCDGVDNNCDGSLYTVDETAYANRDTTATYGTIGSVFSVETPTTLNKFQAYLQGSSGKPVRWAVYVADDVNGPYHRVKSTSWSLTTSSWHWATSGLMDLYLEAGRYYAVTASWSSNTSYYFANSDELPLATSFGAQVASASAQVGSPAADQEFYIGTTTYRFKLTTGGEGDEDGDGYPRCATNQTPQDCDDRSETVYPDAEELCDGLDNNCDGLADAEPGGEGDEDGDGHLTCEDCDDQDDQVHPGAWEGRQEGVDDDCDGDIDEGLTPTPAPDTPTDPSSTAQPTSTDPDGSPPDETPNGIITPGASSPPSPTLTPPVQTNEPTPWMEASQTQRLEPTEAYERTEPQEVTEQASPTTEEQMTPTEGTPEATHEAGEDAGCACTSSATTNLPMGAASLLLLLGLRRRRR